MRLTRKIYRHHYRLSLSVPKRPFWLAVAILTIGLLTLTGLALYRWLNTPRVIRPLHDEQPTPTAKRTIPADQVGGQLGRSLEITDTTGASQELIHYIEKFAKEYGVSVRYLVCLAREESRFDPQAVGDSGRAVGPFQYWLSTWQMFRRQMGLSVEDLRACEKESTRTTAYAISRGLDYHWSVASKCADEKI